MYIPEQYTWHGSVWYAKWDKQNIIVHSSILKSFLMILVPLGFNWAHFQYKMTICTSEIAALHGTYLDILCFHKYLSLIINSTICKINMHCCFLLCYNNNKVIEPFSCATQIQVKVQMDKTENKHDWLPGDMIAHNVVMTSWLVMWTSGDLAC